MTSILECQVGVTITLLTILTVTLGRVQFEDWHCGSNEFTRRMWFDSITKNCEEEIMLLVNHCCVVHDECYTHQLGQDKCDKKFCECNRRSADLKANCRDLLEASCSLVQIFGFGAYHNSANYSEPDDLVKYTLHSTSLKDRYIGIYGQCPKVNATLSSCALQHNLCQESAMKCADSLSVCLHDAASMDGSVLCENAVEEICDATFNGSSLYHVKQQRPSIKISELLGQAITMKIYNRRSHLSAVILLSF
ncbi:hypothetical protein DICVIV_01500 [Dictyocaulus viviparus]|uniref:Phospholipase A2 n=1 Tax=Dictyocaulus viviparus TaxID=29172 RepID=A0A0D8Y633_DICVI|nr:hypothetical protein DICVIV_01500 [Dictyocaulus viviparus]